MTSLLALAVLAEYSGTLVVINQTPYTWEQTYVHSYQMNEWTFPQSIPPGETANIAVGFATGTGVTVSDDGGEVTFTFLDGFDNPWSFQLQARAPSDNLNIQAYMQTLSAANNPQGSTIPLGFLTTGLFGSGSSVFILSQFDDSPFYTNNPPTAWMQSMVSYLGFLTLRNICMPGSHDAGMSSIDGSTAGVTNSDAITQTNSIGGQLAFGSRYFDIRPVISSGIFKTGHYSQESTGIWAGANGQTMSSLIGEINAFTGDNAELIILNLSHDLNTDSGYVSFTSSDWTNLFQQMLEIEHLFVAPNPTTVDLSTMRLEQFIGNGEAAVVVVVQSSVGESTIGSYASSGFYPYGAFDVYNSYINTDNANTMMNDQFTKLAQQRQSPDDPLFLLSWILEQSVADIVGSDSILDLALTAYPMLFAELFNYATQNSYPNILYIDNIHNADVTALALAVNNFAQNI
ncbi:hypothetical protein PHLCEN_2v4219 [Hermanssonia centrifuga]|uniref:PLC-like phosphodiesterase n=1 Tax=Hermanssonia centrifuga TaxID=98765 RepID=A0A2R6PYZ2_9APHY|nr:hypothetical protein PHLCEN_2v4219 [Hermanssonia centrifuga]